jgi:hypothetical protein
MTKPTLLICPGIPKTGTSTIVQHVSQNYFKTDYKETLNQEDITFAKDKLKDAYTLWQEVIGELPKEWL